ncbi:MAG: hypothetical protein AAF533_25010 [Acidobacteriota bacterium]
MKTSSGVAELIVIAVLACHWGGGRAEAWDREVVHPLDWGMAPAVTVDGAGSPILAVGRGRLQVARWDGVAWERELVLDECGIMTDIAWHATGGLAVAYHNQLRGLLQLGWLRGGAWEVHDLSAPAPRLGAKVVFDPLGRPFVAYTSYDDSLGHVLRWDDGWVPELPPSGFADMPQAVADPTGRPVVAYAPDSFATFDGVGWVQTETGLSTWGSYDLAFSRAGIATIARFEDPSDVWHASAATGWTEELAGRATFGVLGASPVGLAFDAADEPVIVAGSIGVHAYRRLAGAWLEPVELSSRGELGPSSVVSDTSGTVFVGHAVLGGLADVSLSRWTTGWETELLASEPLAGAGTELAFQGDGTPALVWNQWPGLWLSRRVAGSWTGEWVAEDDVPSFPLSLIPDAEGRLVLAYHHDRSLRIGRDLEGGWTSEPVTPSNAPWLALAPDGALTIAIGGHGTDLWFGRHDELDGWAWELVRSLEFTNFMFQSLAHDAAGRAVVAYHDRFGAPRSIEVARREPGGWVTEVVDRDVHVENTDLKQAPDGSLWLAYGTRSDTRLAHEEAGGWTVEVLPGVPAYSQVALDFDPDGEPVLAVVSDGISGPVFLSRDAGAWSAEVIDPRLPTSDTVALAFDTDGRPAIGYFSRCRGEVLFATPRDRLLRGWIPRFDDEWRSALPLTELNDVEEGGFPAPAQRGDTVRDEVVADEGLVVYWMLTDDDVLLRVAREETVAVVTIE